MGSRLEKNSKSVRKRIEAHSFKDEEGEEYEGSKFGGFADYFRRKKIKLQNLDAEVRASSPGKPPIFRGIVAHVNGYTQPSLNDLHHLIVSYGGGFMQYLDGKTTVTHIIAANLTPKKAVEFRRYRIVKPAWIVDSVKAGKLLPWDSYRVIDEGVGQRLLGFDDGKVVSQVNTQPRGYREQTNTSWYTSQVKGVADNIDDGDGAHFPSTQAVSVMRNHAYSAVPGASSHTNSTGTRTHKQHDKDDLDSSADFEITPSMEHALDAATIQAGLDREQQEADRKSSSDLLRLPENSEPAQKFLDLVVTEDSDSPISTPSNYGEDFPADRQPEGLELSNPTKSIKEMTAEEHNAILLADPRMRKSSTGNPDFIRQYYAESRLHHLSAWKADLKSRFQQMAAERSASQKQRAKRKPGARRYIMHVDFDSFFCAVSLKSAPQYVDKPAVVAHGTGTGSEIASCNYPARVFGIKNGMWMKQALKLCADIKVLPYDFAAYEEASKGFYEAILDVGGIVQSVSVDEALIDVTALVLPAGGTDGVGISEGSLWREQERADQMAILLRRSIKEITGCDVSVGIGSNILLAKIALRKAKPAGQYQIKPEEALDFLEELNVQDLPGIAYSIGGKLEEIGVKLVKDVRQLSKERLITVLGPKTGEKIWDYSRGIDRTEVGEQAVRKSVSAEVNWGIRFISQEEAEEFVQNLCIELQRRLLEQKVKGTQLTMKIMKKAADAPLDPPKHLGHGKCDTFNKSITFGVATNSAEIIGREAISILRSYNFSPGELRGLGVQMQKLEPLKADTLHDGSQRRLDFGRLSAPKLAKQLTEDPIDDPERPAKLNLNASSYGQSCKAPVQDHIGGSITPENPKFIHHSAIDKDDPIDDKFSPLKPKANPAHPATFISRSYAGDNSARKLNLTGTQFLIPSQVDPNVLADLPPDIRTKLMAQNKVQPSHRPLSTINSRSQSPAPQPLPSQLDPEVFDALPADMRAEILASYSITAIAGLSRSSGQTLLPQSPRKPRPLPLAPLKRTTPTKKRGRPLGSRNNKPDPYSTLKQSAFVSAAKVKPLDVPTDSEGYVSDTLDLDFLSALPDDVRAEVLAENRRIRLAKKGGLMTTVPSGGKKRRAPEPQVGQKRLKLPPREPRPTFTTRELSSLEELREMLQDWFAEFEGDGPLMEDVGALERYLGRVVRDERDLEKVVGVVRWLEWLVGNCQVEAGTRAWEGALEGLKEKVQQAVKERGIGRLEF